MFWNKYLKLCANAGKSPNTVASEIGITSPSVTKWKKGAMPRMTTLNIIANYFHVSPDYFIDDNEIAPSRKVGVKIPVYGQVAAGIPIEAITDIEDYEEISEDLAATGEFAALRIHGQSMEPQLLDGDIVIVRVQDTFEDGDTVIVIINGDDATCKKIEKTPEGVLLVPMNPKFKAMFFSKKDVENLPLRIFGKVIELRRSI